MFTLHTRLMYPEPADTGNGGAPATEGNEPAADTTTTTENTPAKTEETNPFDFAFGEGEPPADATPDTTENKEGEFDLGLTEADGYSKEELPILAELSQKYNLDKDARVGLFKELSEKLSAQAIAAQKAMQQQEVDALKKEWGADFTANAKKGAAFIQRMGVALKWSPEYMASWRTAEGMRLAYGLACANGERNAVGTTAAPAAPSLSRDEHRDVMKVLVSDYYKARAANNSEAARKASDEHWQHGKAVYGSKTPRLLPLP